MNYRVAWRRRLKNVLHDATFYVYEVSRDVAALRQAVADIELALSYYPNEQGESREGTERVLTIAPLGVRFEVFEGPKAVLIYEAVYDSRQPRL